MLRNLRWPRLAVLVSAALLAAFALLWLRVTPLEVGRSDFTSTYVGATLVRTGQAAHLYDERAQSALHGRLIAPDTEGNLPYVDAPPAALVAAPVTFLPLATAYRLWSLLQLGILVLGVVIAVRSAPWPATTPRAWKVAAAGLALATAGTLVELLQAQWGSVLALGLALAYREWRADRLAVGAALLTVSAGVAKPHLAVGLIAFMLGWRRRRLLAGLAIGAGASLAAALAVAGPSGLVQFVRLALVSNTHWELRTFVSFVGIPATFLGNGGVSQLIGALGSVLALVVAFLLGAMVRRRAARLDAALAGAAALSVLAAPHSGIHDLVVLAPAAAWSFALVLPHQRRAAMFVAAWAGLSAAALISLDDGGGFPPGQLTPWLLIALAALSWLQCARPAARLPLTSPGDAAPVGPVADGLSGQRAAARRLLSLPRG